MSQDCLIITILIFLLIGFTILLISLINKLSFLLNSKVGKILNVAILLLVTSTTIMLIKQMIITNIFFLDKLKTKGTFGEKVTKEEVNRAKAILIR